MCFGSAVEMSRLMSETEEIHDCIIAGIDTVAADFEHPAGDASWLIAALLAECGQRYRIDPAQTTLYGSAAAGGYALRALLADGDTWRNAIVCNPRGITSASLEPGMLSAQQPRRIVLVSGSDTGDAQYQRLIDEVLQSKRDELLQTQRRIRAEPTTQS